MPSTYEKTISNGFDYEPIRLSRYENVKQGVKYSLDARREAYTEWSEAYTGSRENLWDVYCDVRDSVPRGTNAKIRKHRLRQEFH